MSDTVCSPGAGSAGRILWIDTVKAMAAWMVVTSHLLRQGVVTDLLAAMSVSIFYVLAGVTMHRHADLVQFVARLLRRIVLPYLAAGLVSIVIYRLLGSYAAGRLGAEGIHTTIPEDLMHLLYGSSVGGRMKWNESLWFLPCYCIVILLAELIERMGQIHSILPAILYIACGYGGFTMIAAGIMGLPWHLETALLVMPLCGAGRYLYRGMQIVRIHPLAALLGGLGWWSVGIEMFTAAEARAAGGSLSLRAVHIAGAPETYWFLMGTSVGAILVIYAATNVRRMPVCLTGLGTHSLDIVLWNKFPVLFLQVVIPVLCPGFDTLFVGREDAAAVLMAAVLALPCMAACLFWTSLYTMTLHRLRAHAGP